MSVSKIPSKQILLRKKMFFENLPNRYLGNSSTFIKYTILRLTEIDGYKYKKFNLHRNAQKTCTYR
jgi:hypothetical protein